MRKHPRGMADWLGVDVADAIVRARFWSKVDKNGPISEYRPDLGPCWIWTAYITPSTGYGWWGYGGRNGVRTTAHRFAYETEIGPVPPKWHVDHLCRNRACVNPGHLEAVTHGENIRRGWSVNLKTHCKNGHEFTPENSYHNGKQRICRECRRARKREFMERNRTPEAPKTHCIHGHEMTEGNTYTRPNGNKECRICRREQFQAWRDKSLGA